MKRQGSTPHFAAGDLIPGRSGLTIQGPALALRHGLRATRGAPRRQPRGRPYPRESRPRPHVRAACPAFDRTRPPTAPGRARSAPRPPRARAARPPRPPHGSAAPLEQRDRSGRIALVLLDVREHQQRLGDLRVPRELGEQHLIGPADALQHRHRLEIAGAVSWFERRRRGRSARDTASTRAFGPGPRRGPWRTGAAACDVRVTALVATPEARGRAPQRRREIC